MDINVQPGRYVVAVSGGVDSMALLDLLHSNANLELIVAHYDHGIREDSAHDRQLVESVARSYGLPFVFEEGKLGAGTSEATARNARYAFLERVRIEHGARAIITAHHQDDVLETAILNLIRGTGRKGLTSLASRPNLVRPLLRISKQQLVDCATEHHLAWHEDSTNAQDRYLRNYIRHHILPRFDPKARARLIEIIEQVRDTNEALDAELASLLGVQAQADVLNRQAFIQLPHAVAKEALASWLRLHRITDFDSQTLERVVIAAKTQKSGAIIDIVGGATLRVEKNALALGHIER